MWNLPIEKSVFFLLKDKICRGMNTFDFITQLGRWEGGFPRIPKGAMNHVVISSSL